MRGAPRLVAPLRLAVARLRARPGRWLPAAVGVALAVTLAGALAGFTTQTADRVAHDRLRGVPVPTQEVTLAWSGGVPVAVDRRAGRALATITRGATQTRAVALQPARFRRLTVRLSGIDPLRRWVRLTAGRLPATCTAARCEVLQLGGVPAPPTLRDRGVTLVVVGRGRLTSPIPLGYVPVSATAASSSDRRAPVLTTAAPHALTTLPQLRSVFRTQTWTAGLPLATLHAWDLQAAQGTLQRVSRDAQLTDPGLTVTAPVQALADARERADAAPRRLRAIVLAAGGVIVALLLLLAGGLRAGLRAEEDRLRYAGAAGGQRALLALAECGVPATLGTAIGAAGAFAAVAALGGRRLIDHALLTGGTSVHALLAAPAAAGLLLLGATASAVTARRLAELTLIATTAGAAILLSDPAVHTGAHGSAVLLPALLLAAGALVLARVTGAGLRALGRTLPGTPRLALLDLARRPGPAVLTVAGLAAAVAFGTFALTVDATQHQGQRDQATFRVPSDAILAAGLQLRRPLQDTPLATYTALRGVRAVQPVLRRDAEVVIGPARSGVTLLADAAPALAVRPVPPPQGPLLGPRTTISLTVASRGDAPDVAAVLRRVDGTTLVVPFDRAGGRLIARTPAAATTVAGLTLRKAQGLAATDGHKATNDVDGSAVSGGRLTLGPLRAGTGSGATIDTSRWTAHGAATAIHHHTISLRFDAAALGVLRPPAPVDREPVPVLVDAGTAADAGSSGRFTLLTGGVAVPAVVAGTVPRVPSVAADDVVLADAATLRAALDAIDPGAGAVDELWVTAAPGTGPQALAASLSRPANGRVTTRAAVLRELRKAPLPRAIARLLPVAAALALLIALLGLASALGAMRRDGAGAHADLEADGATPQRLRRLLTTQAGVVAAAGLLAGLALGLALTPTTTAVLRAGDPRARPPLHAVVPGGTLAVAAALTALTLAAMVLLLSRGAFRAAWPTRPPSVEPA